MQPRQRAREVGNAGERELIEGDGGHVVLKAKADHRCCIGMFRITMIYQRLAKVFLICSDAKARRASESRDSHRWAYCGRVCMAAKRHRTREAVEELAPRLENSADQKGEFGLE
jgi:hypothetical protein